MSNGPTLNGNTLILNEILDLVNNLPEDSGSVELPTLSDPASPSDILSGKEAIDQNGDKITGSLQSYGTINGTIDGITRKVYPLPAGHIDGGSVELTDDIDNEVDAQASLISQIAAKLQGKAVGGTFGTCTVVVHAQDRATFFPCIEGILSVVNDTLVVDYARRTNGTNGVIQYTSSPEDGYRYTIPNVLIGSGFTIRDGNWHATSLECDDISIVCSFNESTAHIVSINATAGPTVTIEIT